MECLTTGGMKIASSDAVILQVSHVSKHFPLTNLH